METVAKEPGQTGSPKDGKVVGEHIHQLLALAESLTTIASHQAGQTALVSTPLGIDMGSLTDKDAAAWAQTLEQLNRFLQGLMVHAAGELGDRVEAGRFQDVGARTPAEFLSSSLKLSRAEANNRLRLAQKFLPVTDALCHTVTPPSQPVLGSAFFSGQTSAEQALVVSGFVDKASQLAKSGTIDSDDVASLESTLTDYAQVEPPYFLRHLGIRALALLDPDGEKPSEAQKLAKQGISFRRPYKGWVRIDGYLTISQYEQTMACIGWATSPKQRDSIQPVELNNASRHSPTEGKSSGQSRELFGADNEPSSSGDSSQESSQHPPGQDALLRMMLVDLPKGESRSGAGQGFGHRLAKDEIPPRPPNAPANAVPPVFEGDSWFWLPESSASETESASERIWGHRLSTDEIPPRPPDAPPYATPPTFEGDSWFWLPDDQQQNVAPDQEPDEKRNQPQDYAEAPWQPEPVPLDEENPDDPTIPEGVTMDDTAAWPRLVNGLWIPEPGSEDALPELSPINPDSTDPAVKDNRTRAQMLLDGMLHCLKLAANTDALPMNGGLKAQLYLSLTQNDLDRRNSDGTVDTPYSGQVPLSLFAEEMCGANVTEMLRDSNGAILDVGRTQRLFTFAQRKILVARDMGCAFPDCMAPAQQTEAHHIIPWQEGGDTSVENGVLCCSLHHHYLHDRGWTVRLVGGIAWFTPPWSVDLTRRERRNSYHHDRIRPRNQR